MGGSAVHRSSRRTATLDRELDRIGASALLVNAASSREPDASALIGRSSRIGRLLLVAPKGEAMRLGFFSPLDRGEAAETGLELLPPDRLETSKASREPGSPALALAHVLRTALEASAVTPSTVALAGRASAGTLHEACRELEEEAVGWRFVAGEEALRRARKHKTDDEVAEIRRVAGVTCEAFREIAGLLASAQPRDGGELWLGGERLRIGVLRASVAARFGRAGLEQPEGSILAPAEEGAVPHNSGADERVLCAGDSLVVDLFPRGRLFADCTRTWCVGEPAPSLHRAWLSVRRALEWAHQRVSTEGVRGQDLQDGVCDLFEREGWPTLRNDPKTEIGYVHSLGHGVGFELHELPTMRSSSRPEREAEEEEERAIPAADDLVETGDVLTLEPGLYQPAEGWAVRLEDLVVMGTEGPENLTPLPYELDPRAW